MANWAETMKQLRTDYVREAKTNLEAVSRLVERLEQGSSVKALPDLTRRFHGLAGSGFTYGFPEVSTLGRRGERACKAMAERGGAALPAELGEWHAVLGGLRREFGFESPAPEAEGEGQKVRTPGKPHVLVIDDDATVRAILAPLLEADGMTVQTAATRAEAMSLIESGLPDAMVVDILLPDGLGYTIVEHVRALSGGKNIPILMISVLHELDDRVDAVHCGADGFFGKPVAWESLQRRLRQLMARRRVRPGRVLVIVDDHGKAAPLERMLGAAGYEVRVCTDPPRARATVATFDPELALTDLLQTAAERRLMIGELQRLGREELPVVLLTEGPWPVILDGSAEREETLVKPVPAERLLSTVASHLERSRLVRRLREHDSLTGLLNHTAFQEGARAIVASSQPRAACILIDVDRFGSVNETHGHRAGDRVLVELASLLKKRLRQSDVLGRPTGQQFAVVLEDLSEAEAARLADRLRAEFTAVEHPAADGSTFRVGFSAGVACLDGVPGTIEGLMRSAAAALRAAKSGGRQRVSRASVLPTVALRGTPAFAAAS